MSWRPRQTAARPRAGKVAARPGGARPGAGPAGRGERDAPRRRNGRRRARTAHVAAADRHEREPGGVLQRRDRPRRRGRRGRHESRRRAARCSWWPSTPPTVASCGRGPTRPSPATRRRLAFDSQGNLYAGVELWGGNPNVAVVKLDGTGAVAWSDVYDHSGGWEWVTGVAVDADDNVVLCGDSEMNGPNTGLYARKYDGAGTLLWGATHRPLTSTGLIQCRDMAVDPDGDVYVAGRSVSQGRRSRTPRSSPSTPPTTARASGATCSRARAAPVRTSRASPCATGASPPAAGPATRSSATTPAW